MEKQELIKEIVELFKKYEEIFQTDDVVDDFISEIMYTYELSDQETMDYEVLSQELEDLSVETLETLKEKFSNLN